MHLSTRPPPPSKAANAGAVETHLAAAAQAVANERRRRKRGAHRVGAVAGAAAPGSTGRIVDAITAAIVERRLMPGTKLAEQKIADIFRVSRTIVRQALNQLSRDRLVTLTPARGAFVATPSVEEARQVFEARRMIEEAVVRRLCSAVTDEQLDRLEAHLDAERAALSRTDVPCRTRLLADFHAVMASMLGNAVMTDLLGDLLGRSSLIALMYQSSHSAAASHAEHVAIVGALTRRDARAAVRLTAQHLHHVERNLRLDPRSADLSSILTEANE